MKVKPSQFVSWHFVLLSSTDLSLYVTLWIDWFNGYYFIFKVHFSYLVCRCVVATFTILSEANYFVKTFFSLFYLFVSDAVYPPHK